MPWELSKLEKVKNSEIGETEHKGLGVFVNTYHRDGVCHLSTLAFVFLGRCGEFLLFHRKFYKLNHAICYIYYVCIIDSVLTTRWDS